LLQTNENATFQKKPKKFVGAAAATQAGRAGLQARRRECAATVSILHVVVVRRTRRDSCVQPGTRPAGQGVFPLPCGLLLLLVRSFVTQVTLTPWLFAAACRGEESSDPPW